MKIHEMARYMQSNPTAELEVRTGNRKIRVDDAAFVVDETHDAVVLTLESDYLPKLIPEIPMENCMARTYNNSMFSSSTKELNAKLERGWIVKHITPYTNNGTTIYVEYILERPRKGGVEND